MTEKITEIAITRKIVQNLLHHAQQTPDQEVCGLVSSRNNTPYRSYPIKNNSPEPTRFFNLDAQQQIQAMATMRDNNEQLFAIYHSHPTAPAIPSNTDLAQANYPETLYLIISLNTKGILEIRGYLIDKFKFIEVPLNLI
ncbi:MAG: M67 family metallopeptidase [Methyloprofundus sp.]|nr:M67 family metallopeptidase [Methyloprofundus sp.]MBW6453077.1 M67 family metallopeptidase [Methyloprofundus sp.]